MDWNEEDEQGPQNIRKPIVKLSQLLVCVFVEAILNGDKNIMEYYLARPGWFPVFPLTEEMATPSELNAPEKTFGWTQIPLSPGFAAYIRLSGSRARYVKEIYSRSSTSSDRTTRFTKYIRHVVEDGEMCVGSKIDLARMTCV